MFTRLLVLFSVLMAPLSSYSQDIHLKKRARYIHDKYLTIDSHTDTPLMIGREGFSLGERNDPRNRGGKLDFPRMHEGGLDAVFFAVFVGQDERTIEGNEQAKKRALQIFDNIHKSLDQFNHMAGLALKPDDAYRLKREGKSAIFIGLENAYPIGNDLSMISEFYDMGARYITLSHTRNNDVCDSSTDTIEHNGLSDFGKSVVQEMNILGMMVDVSHISDKAFYDVLEITSTPIIASHSNARAICNHPRNMNDDMLKALKENGGVVQVCVLSAYVKEANPNPERDAARNAIREKFNNFQGLTDEQMAIAREEWHEINRIYPPELATVSDLVDHIDHIVNTIGIDFVGIGTDFDGGGALEDCYDVSELPNITAELLRRGYSESDIGKIWSGNFMRVFREVEAARKMHN
jgi:membrane dipeptidase